MGWLEGFLSLTRHMCRNQSNPLQSGLDTHCPVFEICLPSTALHLGVQINPLTW